MTRIDRPRPTVLALAAMLLAGACATSANRAAADPAAEEPALALASSFALAADAAAKGDTALLAQALAAIDASGARPLEGDPADPLPAWRDAVAGIGSPPYRGRPLGPGYRSGRLDPGAKEKFSQLFLSGSGATIALSAPTGDKLALRVVGPDDKLICADATGRGGLCKWVPLFTQRYTIEVTNLGKGDARYFLVVQ